MVLRPALTVQFALGWESKTSFCLYLGLERSCVLLKNTTPLEGVKRVGPKLASGLCKGFASSGIGRTGSEPAGSF